jgi:hypothetical protein
MAMTTAQGHMTSWVIGYCCCPWYHFKHKQQLHKQQWLSVLCCHSRPAGSGRRTVSNTSSSHLANIYAPSHTHQLSHNPNDHQKSTHALQAQVDKHIQTSPHRLQLYCNTSCTQPDISSGNISSPVAAPSRQQHCCSSICQHLLALLRHLQRIS